MPQCPNKDCSGFCVEKAGDWWYCSVCECWYPGAHLRSKGCLGKTAKKKSTKSKKRRSKSESKPSTPSNSPKGIPEPSKSSKPRKGIRKPPKGTRKPRL